MLAKDLRITDPVHRPVENPGLLNRQLLRLLNDPRDLPFLHFILEANLVVVPMAAWLFLAPWTTMTKCVAALYLPITIGTLPHFHPKIRVVHSASPLSHQYVATIDPRFSGL